LYDLKVRGERENRDVSAVDRKPEMRRRRTRTPIRRVIS
jgi:hypothetical protein